MTEETKNEKQENGSTEFTKQVGLELLALHFRERTFMELALDNALVPKQTDAFARITNGRIRRLMRALERLLLSYRSNPPPRS